jgi:hypothetical protein
MSAASIVKAIANLTAKGFPEEVAERIAKGELPMDPASVAKRSDEQGYGPVLYRGHGEERQPRSDEDLWMTDDYGTADTYAGTGEWYDEATDSYQDALGAITPLRHNAGDNLFHLDGKGAGYEDIYIEPNDVPGLSKDRFINDYRSEGTDGIAEIVKAEGTRKGTFFEDIEDAFEYHDEMTPSNVYNILGSRDDVKIRHPDAAFDPQYNGPNIMGGATVPMLGLLSSGTAGAGLLMKSLFAEAEEAKKRNAPTLAPTKR